MRIFALFDDPDAIQKARHALEKEGRGDEVVKVVSPHLDDDQAVPAPVMGSGQSVSGPAVVNQAGHTAPQATVDTAVTSLGQLNLPPAELAAFEQELSKDHAQILVLDTDDDAVESTKEMLASNGANLVATS